MIFYDFRFHFHFVQNHLNFYSLILFHFYFVHSNLVHSNHSNVSTIKKTGLVNLGDSSYLNAVLQLLGNIKNLANYFLVPENQKMLNDNIKYKPLSFVIYRLFTHLYPKEENKGEIYKPDALKKMLGYLNVVYRTDKKRNPNELICFILDTLHKELNTKNPNNPKQTPDMSDKDKFINVEITNFNNSNDSVISNSFNWFEIKECKCNKCKKAVYNFNSFNTFEFDISGCYQLNKKPITLNDCINFYCQQKQRNLFCNSCKNKSNMSITSDIYNARDILIFSLNRGNLDKNLLKIPFNLEYMVNLKSFITNSNSPKYYDLIGIASVFMKEQNCDYVAFCKSNNQWFLFEDENINEIQWDSILSWHNAHTYVPCILAYQVIGTQ
jgi:ubiquitin C-terminal hydrolase